MTGISRDLGVSCAHCHDQAAMHRDDLGPRKRMARAAIPTMWDVVSNVNKNYFPGTGGLVSCWSCHRGSPAPERVAPTLAFGSVYHLNLWTDRQLCLFVQFRFRTDRGHCPPIVPRLRSWTMTRRFVMRVGIYRRGRIWWARWTQDGKKSYRSLQTDNRQIAVELGLRLQKRLLLGDEPGKAPRVPIERLLGEYEAWSKANKRPRTVLNDTARIRGYTDLSAISGRRRCSSRLSSPPQPQQCGQALDPDDGVDNPPEDRTLKDARGLLDRLIGRKEPERTKTHESEQNNDDGTGPDRPGHENAHEDKQGQQS